MDAGEWNAAIRRCAAGEMSDRDCEEWQSRALRGVLRHVQEKSPFYRRRLAGVDPAEVGLEGIADLPYTTKSDLQSAMYEIVCGDVRDALFFFSTTGTTGAATPCPRAAIDTELNNAAVAAALDRVLAGALGPDRRPLMAVLIPNELHSVCINLSLVARELGFCKLDVFPLSPVVGFERLFELLLELKVDVLFGSSGLIMPLAELAEVYGIDIREDLGIECVLCTGELCSPSMAKLIGSTWGATAHNFMYGSQEAGSMALGDPEGRLVPLRANHIFEVVDVESGESLGFEGRGELCLTTLVPGARPLIRFRTGDLVSLERSTAGELRMEVLGRIKDMVEIGGRAYSAAAVDGAILAEHGLVYGYQIEIAEEEGRERVTVRVKPKEGTDHEAVKKTVAASFRQATGCECAVELLPLLDVASATGGWVSWKSARIDDRRTGAADDSTEQEAASMLAQAAERML